MKTINKPVKLSKPGVLSAYMATWKTGSGNTITNVSIVYNPKKNLICQSIIIDIVAFLGTN